MTIPIPDQDPLEAGDQRSSDPDTHDRHLHAVDGDTAPTTEPPQADDNIAEDEWADTWEVDDIDDVPSIPVDVEQTERATRLFDVDRSDVLPEWATSRQALKDRIVILAGLAVFWIKFHTAHAPLYAGRLLLWSPIGVWRATVGLTRWVADLGSRDARQALTESVRTDSRGTSDLRILTVQHRDAVRIHLAVAVTGLLVGFVVLIWAATAWPWQERLLGAAGLITALGIAGRPADRSITDRAVSIDRPERLSWDLIEEALAALGIRGINAAFKTAERTGGPVMIHKATPIKEVRTGYTVEIDLPRGVTVEDVANKRKELASGLRRPVSCVFTEHGGGDDEHQGRLALFVANKPLRRMPQRDWPLLTKGRTSVFGEIPFGVDARGNSVSGTLFEQSALIGALPGIGKTKALLILAMGAALDPTVEVHVHDFKGMGDWASFEQIAHVFNANAEHEDPVGVLLTDLRQVQASMAKQAGTIGRVVRDNPGMERKLSADLVAKRSLGVRPIVIVIDECQVAFTHPDFGKEIAALIEDIIRRGRAAGVILLLATQKPNRDAIPTGVRDNVSLRFALKVMSLDASNMILGDGASSAGFRATEFAGADKGICYYRGPEGDPKVVRLDYVEDEFPVMTRARVARDKLGLLTGHAAGDDTDDESESIVDHLLAVWPVGEDKASYEQLADLLAAKWPGTYEGWGNRQVSAAVKAHGINVDGRPPQVKRNGQNRNGVSLADLVEANTTDSPDLAPSSDEPDRSPADQPDADEDPFDIDDDGGDEVDMRVAER